MSVRRGSILLLVLVVIAVSALIVASALRQSLAAGWAAAASDRQLESRLAAWSGIEMVMAELQSQRPQLLTGNSPTLTDQIVVQPKDQGGTIVRLVPFGPHAALPENAKLPLNTAVVEWIAKLPGFDLTAATAIDTHRCRVAFGSIEELQLLGYDPSELQLQTPTDPDESTAPRASLASCLSVFNADAPDPAIDPLAEQICLCEELGDADKRAINDLAGMDLAAVITTRTAAGSPITSRSDFASLALGAGIDVRKVGELLDRITLTRSLEPTPRIDLNSAPAEVLACLPGLDASSAKQIVDARDRVNDQDRQNILWPVFMAGVEMEKLLPSLDHLGVRSMVWRVRVEAGRADSLDSSDERAELSSRVSLEAVIDLSTDRPRVVYLRDVSHLAIAGRLSDILPMPEAADEVDPPLAPSPDLSSSGLAEPQTTPTRPSGRVSRWSVPK